MREYKIRGESVLEFRDGQEFREVSPEHQGYAAWLAEGNVAEVMDALPEQLGPPLEAAKAVKKAEAEAFRNQVRAGGVAFAGSRLAAMPEDQGTYGDSITYLGWKPEGTTLKWKALDSWIEVDLPTLRAAAEAVGDFIEALFEAEHAHHVAIDSLATLEEVHAYDVTTGWPGQEG